MKPQYSRWINDYVTDPLGKCLEICTLMRQSFPTLSLVRGHYICPIWGMREHWWLVDGSEIIDPTKGQFPSQGIGEYVEHCGEEPTGKCISCGKYCYGREHFCSQDCKEMARVQFPTMV